jgi:hypothetical protein
MGPNEIAELMNDYRDGSERSVKYERALMRFRGLKDAISDGMDDSVIIRCEVTVGDIRAMVNALGSLADFAHPLPDETT